jgi:hypothetical protein
LKTKFTALVLLLFCLQLQAQETDLTPETDVLIPDNEISNDDNNTVFYINNIDFEITGRTRADALMYKGEFKLGEEITGKNSLEKYVQEKNRILFNERVLDYVEVSYELGDAVSDKIPVNLRVIIRDTWNVIALPYPKYSSSSGFELILKARDYNFLGTMNPLRLDLGYKYDEEGRSYYLFSVTSNTPFMALGYKWNFIFNNYFNYRPDSEEPYYYKNTTGLSFELPVKQTTITIGFEESLFLNEENSIAGKLDTGKEFQNGIYLASNPYIEWKIPSTFEVFGYGPLVYTPKISAVFNHEIPDWELQEIRKGPYLGFGHVLGFDKIDWIGNFRKGLDINIDNSFSYDFHKYQNDEQGLRSNLYFTAIGHFILADFFGFSTRLMYRHWFLDDRGYMEAGDVLRGTLNKDVTANYMISLNTDFTFKILVFMLSQWWDSKSLGEISPLKWIHSLNRRGVFDFELQLSPIFDIAFYKSPFHENSISMDNLLYTGGLEMVIFPYFMRSLYLRLSMAWNLSEFNQGKNREIFVGIGHHY